jgi:hypothetical protein
MNLSGLNLTIHFFLLMKKCLIISPKAFWYTHLSSIKLSTCEILHAQISFTVMKIQHRRALYAGSISHRRRDRAKSQTIYIKAAKDKTLFPPLTISGVLIFPTLATVTKARRRE